MKKFVFFVIVLFSLFSCTSDDGPRSEPTSLPIESVVVPVDCIVNEERIIKITYRRPTTCHFFNGFNYQYTDEFIRTVSIEAIKLNEDNCVDASMESYEIDLKFKPLEIGVYHFKFWSGVDENGNYTCLEHDIEVQ